MLNTTVSGIISLGGDLETLAERMTRIEGAVETLTSQVTKVQQLAGQIHAGNQAALQTMGTAMAQMESKIQQIAQVGSSVAPVPMGSQGLGS